MGTYATTVIAVDPGRTTGVCVAQYRGVTPEGIQDFSVSCMELEWDDRWGLEALLHRFDPSDAVVVCESFNLYPEAARGQANIRSDFPSVQVIGILQAYAHKAGYEVVFQMPATRKTVRILEWHKVDVGKSPHCQDAYRHARYYIVTHYKDGSDARARPATK